MKTRTAFNLENETLERLHKLPREVLPNKSALVERLLVQWLDELEKNDEGL